MNSFLFSGISKICFPYLSFSWILSPSSLYVYYANYSKVDDDADIGGCYIMKLLVFILMLNVLLALDMPLRTLLPLIFGIVIMLGIVRS